VSLLDEFTFELTFVAGLGLLCAAQGSQRLPPSAIHRKSPQCRTKSTETFPLLCRVISMPEWMKEFFWLLRDAAWPIAVVIVAAMFKCELVSALTSLPGRGFKLEGWGFKAELNGDEQKQAGAESPVNEKIPTHPILTPNPRTAVNTIEANLRRELNEIEDDKREPALLRALALTRLEAGHEFTYNRIFGSQIAGLRQLNAMGRASIDQARAFYEPYANFLPSGAGYNFDTWLGFLLNLGLVLRNGDWLEITDFGRDFLQYLTERRLSENKPG
jgi:hypothetical protein